MTSLELGEAVELAARVAANAGATGVEVYGVKYRRITVSVTWKGLESLLRNDEAGIGIRVHVGKRVAFTYTNRLTTTSIINVAENIVKIAKTSPVDPNFPGFYDGDSIPHLEGLYSPFIRQRIEDPDDLVENILDAAKTVMDDKRIKLTMIYAGIGEAEHIILNSEGVYANAPTTYSRVVVDLVATDGTDTSPSIYEYGGSRLQIPDVKKLALNAAEKAVNSMKRVKVDLPDKMMVILRPQAFVELFDYTYGAALSGRNYVNRSSPFKDKLG
ncbi:MAG: metallopeptidase TldD-related protein, partial [Desulfurococcales archaeon]|nr:metallopeptidase TldD-related protein [Desulfurococcales archaeon]